MRAGRQTYIISRSTCGRSVSSIKLCWIADFQRVLAIRSDLDDLAHELVAHDVAVLHTGHVAVIKVRVGAADRAARHLDDGIARVLDARVGNIVAANVFWVVPAQGFQGFSGPRV